MKKNKCFENLGLCLSRKKLAWTSKGFGWWMPSFVTRTIIAIWNFIACIIFGHYFFPDFDSKKGGVWKKDKNGLTCPVGHTHEICCDCGKRRIK